MKTDSITSGQILEEMATAIKRFGTYTFDDKGPREVMNVQSIAKKIKAMPKERAARFLKEMIDAEGYEGRNVELANVLAGNCEDMDEEWFGYVLDNSGAKY